MRQPKRNQRKFWYRNQTGRETVYDGEGYEDGDSPTYSDPVEMYGSLEQRDGVTGDYLFGLAPGYDFILSLPVKVSPVAVGDVVNYLSEPADSSADYDLVVLQVKPSLRSVVCALGKPKP